jgi:hypothetical protein
VEAHDAPEDHDKDKDKDKREIVREIPLHVYVRAEESDAVRS